LRKESPEQEDFISVPNGTAVTATVLKAGKPRLPCKQLAPFEKYEKNTVDGFETWSNIVVDQIIERLAPHGENGNDLQVASEEFREKFGNDIGVNGFQINRDDMNASTQMIMLHNYVTFQGQSLEEGEEVSFLMKGERGWAQVMDKRGTKTWVPHSYLQELGQEADSPVAETGSAVSKCKNHASDFENENLLSLLELTGTACCRIKPLREAIIGESWDKYYVGASDREGEAAGAY
jgi:hypothetical protein